MSITDELREWFENAYNYGPFIGGEFPKKHATPWFGWKSTIVEMLDRIDAEHEEKVSYWQGACYEDGYKEGLADHEDAMAEHGWVKLPMDADGEVIHIGDRMENNERVVRIVLTDGSWEPSVYVEKRPNVLHEYFCNEISHYHEPAVEDVLREFFSRYVRYVKTNPKEEDDAIIAEYAAKLRLAGDA